MRPFELRRELGSDHVFRLPAEDGALGLVPAYEEGGILFDEHLTFAELGRRFDAGARIIEVPVNSGSGPRGVNGDLTPLFVVAEDGGLRVVSAGAEPEARPGETLICLAE